MRKLLFKILIWGKGLFAFRLEDSIQGVGPGMSVAKRMRNRLLKFYNENREDKIEYTNTHEDHHSNFKHLDDYTDKRFQRIGEQIGLIYEEDGKTPKNAAEVFDMTYEIYEEYKEKILPQARDIKLTPEIIEGFLEKRKEPKLDPLDRIKENIKEQRKLEAQQKVADAVLKLRQN